MGTLTASTGNCNASGVIQNPAVPVSVSGADITFHSTGDITGSYDAATGVWNGSGEVDMGGYILVETLSGSFGYGTDTQPLFTRELQFGRRAKGATFFYCSHDYDVTYTWISGE